MTKNCPICLGEIKTDEEIVRDEITQQEYHKACHEYITDVIG